MSMQRQVDDHEKRIQKLEKRVEPIRLGIKNSEKKPAEEEATGEESSEETQEELFYKQMQRAIRGLREIPGYEFRIVKREDKTLSLRGTATQQCPGHICLPLQLLAAVTRSLLNLIDTNLRDSPELKQMVRLLDQYLATD